MKSEHSSIDARADSRTSTSQPFSRRQFLRTTAAAAVAAPYFVPSTVLGAPGRPGANDKLNIGVIGAGNRVSWLVSNWGNPADMRLAALADCNAAKMAVFIDRCKGKFPGVESCGRYEDYQEMLEKEELDGVFITTPTHGRVAPCIRACQAGVHIYAEKPVTLTIHEGQALVKAAKKARIVFQAGTQARSISVNDWAVRKLKEGALGAVKHVLVPNYEGPVDYQPIGDPKPIPEGMNWDLWCNQAPLFPYDPKIASALEDGWAPYRPFDGGGERWGLTGFGTHTFDQILWALGRDTESPVEIHPHAPDQPNCATTLRFADGFEIEMMEKIGKGPAFGGIFTCENGKMEINRDRVETNPPDLARQIPKFESGHTSGVSHVQDWLNCIRGGETTRCPIDVAHRQSVICHVINAARDLGRDVRYDPAIDRFIDDDEANRHPSVARERRKGYELPVGESSS